MRKIYYVTLFITFILFFPSCYNKLEFDHSNYPTLKKDDVTPAAVVINGKFIKDDFYFTNNDSSKSVDFIKIREKIKKDIDARIERPVVYFYDLTNKDILALKKDFEKVIVIDTQVSKSLNFTGVLDYASVIYPFPAPEWGFYVFDTNIKVMSSLNENVQQFSYKITSDYSYMIYPLYRNDAQLDAIRKAVLKLLDEMLSNKDLVRLFSFDGDIGGSLSYQYIIEESGVRLVQRDKYSSFPLSIDFRSLFGSSEINGYYDNNGTEELGATGTGFVKEFKVQASSYKPTTRLYLTPTFGYYYQDIEIEDFGYDTSRANSNKDGFITGRIEERDSNGNIIQNSNPYSLSYRSQFSSTYLGGKAGLNIILGDSVRFIFSPLVYFSLIEARHTTITAGGNEFSDWTFPFAGIVGFNFETGLFFTEAHFGIKLGYDLTYFRRFDFAYNINFNKVVTNEEGLEIGKKIEVNRFNVFSNRFFFDIFVVF